MKAPIKYRGRELAGLEAEIEAKIRKTPYLRDNLVIVMNSKEFEGLVGSGVIDPRSGRYGTAFNMLGVDVAISLNVGWHLAVKI